MALDRRGLLKSLFTAGAAVVAGPAVAKASGGGAAFPPEKMTGMLYDATLCIGCKACMVACREENGLEPDPTSLIHDAPPDLNARAKNIIKLYAEDGKQSFMKMQCMHCVDPACASACMLGALKKREDGAVTWDGDLCVGCRYCQVACPFNVPKFEWDSAAPKIVKCELCPERRAAGRVPACVEVCPREAVIYGPREALLKEAHRRIAASPSTYEPKIYGEKDAGGTQVLYLSAAGIGFEKLGLPELGVEPLPERTRGVQGLLYKGFVAPVALYGVLATVIHRNRKQGAEADTHAGEDAR